MPHATPRLDDVLVSDDDAIRRNPGPLSWIYRYCLNQPSPSDCLQSQCYSNTSYTNLFECINQTAPCYFNCLNIPADRILFDGSVMGAKSQRIEQKITELVDIGRAGAICSILASSLFILISVYLKRYQRWIEQIILSKVVCDLSFAAVLLYYFDTFFKPLLRDTFNNAGATTELYTDTTIKSTFFRPAFVLEVLLMLGLLWIPVLLNEVRSIIKFPFSAWAFSKLFNRWCFALFVAFSWTFLILEYPDKVNFFQYVPIVFIGKMTTSSLNSALLVLLYVPIGIVLVVIVGGIYLAYQQLKPGAGSKYTATARRYVLRVSFSYMVSFFLYLFMVFVSYLVGIPVHTCTHPSPFCVAWTGWDCNQLEVGDHLINSQRFFIFLFCARGILDFIVFLYFSFPSIVKRFKGQEYNLHDVIQTDDDEDLNLNTQIRKEIMNLIQVGISRSSLKNDAKEDDREPTVADFTVIEDVNVFEAISNPVVGLTVVTHSASRRPSLRDVQIPPSPSAVRFQALAPKVFESIRRSASISATEYAEAMNPTSQSDRSDAEEFNIEESQANILIEKFTDGRGGAFFYFSQNYKFVIKTITDSEYNFMRSILRRMWQQMVRDDTTLSRYLGVYTFLYQGADIKIVVMENVSYMLPRLPIHRKYDLKGSWVAREMIKPNEAPLTPTEEDKRTLKDMDMCYTVGLTSQSRKDLIAAIKKDTDFLADVNIMDYSLFLSFHIVATPDSHGTENLDLGAAPSAPATPAQTTADSSANPNRGFFRQYKGGMSVQLDVCDPIERMRRPDGRSAHHATSRISETSNDTALVNFRTSEGGQDSSGFGSHGSATRQRKNDSLSVLRLGRSLEAIMYCARSARPVSRCIAFHCVCRYVGIIDFLQQWNLQKRAERNWKVYMRRVDPDGVSAMVSAHHSRMFHVLPE